MENAAKALMMAGGVLLAMLIIIAGIYVWQQNANFSYELEQQEETERIISFNKQYESYHRQALRGIDVLTVINKIRDNNIKYSEEDELQMTWEVILKEDFPKGSEVILNKATHHKESNSGNLITQILNNKALLTNFKSLSFKCSSLEYSNKTKKVNKMVFEQYTIADDEFFGK